MNGMATCRKCGASGPALDEFTSPYTGLCQACSKEREAQQNDRSALAPKSVLRLRARPHLHPERGGEAIVEVVREGEVVATIYGSREGVHIVSPLFDKKTRPQRAASFYTDVPGAMSGLLVPLLRRGETCPWCNGGRKIVMDNATLDCPLCTGNPKET